MTAIMLQESKRFQRSSLMLTGAFAGVSVFFLAVFPALREEAELVQEAYPEAIVGILGLEELHTIEGFSAGYIYPLLWTLFGGVYFAYLGAGLIAGDRESRRLDLLLSNPVSRESVLVQKVAALWLPLLVLNVGVAAILFVGARVVGETFALWDLWMVHLLSVPYLLVCAGIGLVLSTVRDREGGAQAIAIVGVFVLWLVDGLSVMNPGFEWIGDLTPSRYFAPNDILVRQDYAFLDAALLFTMFVVLVGGALIVFTRRDL